MNTNELELKCQALLERFGQSTQQYEGAVADLRVQITVAQNELQELRNQNSELRTELLQLREALSNVGPEEADTYTITELPVEDS